MMYGAGIPLLFPILTISLIVFYLHERYHLAYTYRLPPALDDKLVRNTMNVLKYAPMFLMFNGYWMLSNKQIFFSEVSARVNQESLMPTNHFVDQVFSLVGP